MRLLMPYRLFVLTVGLAAILPLLPLMSRLDQRIGWHLLAGSGSIDLSRGVLVDLDAATTETDGALSTGRRTLASLVNILADSGVEKLYIDSSFTLPRKSDDTLLLAQALSRFGPERAAVVRPPTWRHSGFLVLPELAPYVSVLAADQPVNADGWVREVSSSNVTSKGLTVAPRWLVGQSGSQSVTVHPGARTDGIRRMPSSEVLSFTGGLQGLKGTWVVLASGPDLPGQRSHLHSQGPLTRGQVIALAAAVVQAGMEPRELIPLAASLICAILAAAAWLFARARLLVSVGLVLSMICWMTLMAVLSAEFGATVVPLASAAVGVLIALLFGQIAAQPRLLQARAWLMAAVGTPIPGWRAFRSDLDPVVLAGRDGTIIDRNAKAITLLPVVGSRGARVVEVLGPDIAARTNFSAQSETAQAIVHLEAQSLWLEATMIPVHSDPALSCVIKLRDITAMQMSSLRLSRLVERDVLTGVHNRVGLANRYLEAKTALTLLLIDLDGFKPVNDRYGHAAGDMVLRAISDRLSAVTGLVLARLGGDEFAVLMARDAAAPADLAAKVEDLIRQPIRYGEVSLSVGASIGWAVSDVPLRPLDEMLEEADQAMYRVKDRRHSQRRRDSATNQAA
ncbi:MAG: sensor domain-containing diguanylate cyclase [Hyphomicrobiales bacterium]|nr:sensor domain-containing diguanylate cyclase [Hyphomicrobiales bacterium]